MMNNNTMKTPTLRDTFGRQITYLRLSITDRCDFRCVYCMAEDMTFLPRKEVLSLEELYQVAQAFVSLGVTKIRITGGEPLIRKDAMRLFHKVGQLKTLKELCLTTNGSQLTHYSDELINAGVKRINISLDTLRATRFKSMTRHGKLDDVLAGIEAAQQAGFERIKLNAVLMKNYNYDEAEALAQFAIDNDLDISFIEEMPLGEVTSHQRQSEFISSDELRQRLSQSIHLEQDDHTTGGPSRYWQVKGQTSKIGFISPHSHNFCDSCNRVRVTTSGRLLLCLGNEHSLDLRSILRTTNTNSDQIQTNLQYAIIESMKIKPEKHEFTLNETPQILRFMNTTGG